MGCKGEFEDLDDKSIFEGREELIEEAEEVGNNWDLSRDFLILFWLIFLFVKDCIGCWLWLGVILEDRLVVEVV